MARRTPLKITRIQLDSILQVFPTFRSHGALNFCAPLDFELTGTGTTASRQEHTSIQMNLLNLNVLGQEFVAIGCDRRHPFG